MAARGCPAEPGNELALKHGATSERHIAPLARNHKRRVLRQIGLAARDLDAVARGYLDLYCRTAAKIDLCDRYLDEHGLLDEGGEPQPLMKMYVSLVNSSRLALEDHLHDRMAREESLAEYVEREYGGNDC
jgi:hypothetical protein